MFVDCSYMCFCMLGDRPILGYSGPCCSLILARREPLLTYQPRKIKNVVLSEITYLSKSDKKKALLGFCLSSRGINFLGFGNFVCIDLQRPSSKLTVYNPMSRVSSVPPRDEDLKVRQSTALLKRSRVWCRSQRLSLIPMLSCEK